MKNTASTVSAKTVNTGRILAPLLVALAAHDTVVDEARKAAEPAFVGVEKVYDEKKGEIDSLQAEINGLNDKRRELGDKLRGLGTSKAEAAIAKTLDLELEKVNNERNGLIAKIQGLREAFRPHRTDMEFVAALRAGVLPVSDGRPIRYRGENKVIAAAALAVYNARSTLYVALTGQNGCLMPVVEVLGNRRIGGLAEILRKQDGTYAVPAGKAGDEVLSLWERITALGVNVSGSQAPDRVQVAAILSAELKSRQAKAAIKAAMQPEVSV